MDDFIRNVYAMQRTQKPFSAYRYANNTQTQATQLDAKPKTQQTHRIEPNPIFTQSTQRPANGRVGILRQLLQLPIFYLFILLICSFGNRRILLENGVS
jgi:hypothetical protein